MNNRETRTYKVILCTLIILIVLTSCAPKLSPTESENTSTPSQPPFTSTPLDLSEITPTLSTTEPYPLYYPIENCSQSRLHILNIVMLEEGLSVLNIQNSPSISSDSVIITRISLDDYLLITDGPACIEGWIFWKVQRLSDNVSGWILESDKTGFLLLPVGSIDIFINTATATSTVIQPSPNPSQTKTSPDTPIVPPAPPAKTGTPPTPIAPPPITVTPIVPPPPPPTITPILGRPECNDGIDNDGDGYIDWSNPNGNGDPDCKNKQDDDESQ